MTDAQILERVSEECERLERLCRKAAPRLAKAFLILAWFAIEEINKLPMPSFEKPSKVRR
ncbi:MAG: hypothetical protein ABL932_25530 [Terricaulis sp.]